MFFKSQVIFGIYLLVVLVKCINETTTFNDWKKLYLESLICQNKKTECESQIKDCEDWPKTQNFKVEIQKSVTVIRMYTYHYPDIDLYKELIQNCKHNKTLFSDFVYLLQTAINTVREEEPRYWKRNVTTFRGIDTIHITSNGCKDVHEIWSEDGFTSTSTLSGIALDNSKFKTFQRIKNVNGLSIESFSKFPVEEEVLINYPSNYLIKKITDTPREIKTEMINSYVIGFQLPLLFYELEMINQRKKRMATHVTQCFALISAEDNVISAGDNVFPQNLVILPLLIFVLEFIF